MAARRDPGRKIGEARTGAAPVSPTLRGNSALVRAFTFIAYPRRSLSSSGTLTAAAATKNARNSRGHPPGTGRTSAGALHRRRFTLDGPNDPRIIEPGNRADTHGFHVGAAHVSSPFSTCLASPFVYYRNDAEPLIPCPSSTDRQPPDRWQNLTNRGARTDRREDRWGPLVCGGTDESHSGIRTAHSRQRTLRTHRGILHAGDSCHAARLVVKEYATAVSPAHCPSVRDAVPGNRRDATRAAGPSLYRGWARRAGHY